MTGRQPDAADLHSPEELLATAEALLALGDPQMYRAAVAEAITALESYVSQTVFDRLDITLDPLLVRWLKERTRSDFDARLSVFAPLATGREVDTRSELWKDYKTARDIRNRVAHAGARVTQERAMFVVETVRRWMSFIGSTAELTVTLDGLRRYVETSGVPVASSQDAESIVRRYFAKAPRNTVVLEHVLEHGLELDFVLAFSDQDRVGVEVKYRPRPLDHPELDIRAMVESHAARIREARLARGALIVFMRSEPPEAYRTARVVQAGTISVVVVHAANP